MLKAGSLEMSADLRAKALKTENVNFLLYFNVTPGVISDTTVIGCMLFDRNCMCYMEFRLRALFSYEWAAVERVARAIDLNLNARLSMPF